MKRRNAKRKAMKVKRNASAFSRKKAASSKKIINNFGDVLEALSKE